MIKSIFITTSLLASSLAFSAQNYVVDPQLTDYRQNKGSSGVWLSHEDSKGGFGDVGSSGDTAFGPEGSVRMRFKKDVAINDFTAKPGLSQIITGLPVYTDMVYSLYYCDKKGPKSQSILYYGVREVDDGIKKENTRRLLSLRYYGVREEVKSGPLSGKVIAENRVHTKELNGAPRGNERCFIQASGITFNSGSTGTVEIFSLMEVDLGDTGIPITNNDLEVRMDEYSVTIK